MTVDARPYLSFSVVGLLATAGAWVALGLTGFQIFLAFGGDVLWPLLAGTAAFAFVSAGVLFDRAAWSTRNPAGREMWSRVGGFARFLTTDSADRASTSPRRWTSIPGIFRGRSCSDPPTSGRSAIGTRV